MFKGRLVVQSLLCGAAAFLAGCKGGSDSAPGTNVVRAVTSSQGVSTSFTAGVFPPASQYKDRCAVPRSGVDIEGNAFPDQRGSTTLENFWLRSWTHETYLWNDEVVDRDPSRYDNRLEYFDLLRTEERTSSGAFKDNFHFSQPTEEFLRQRNSAPEASYGVSYAILSASPPRDIRVRYTDPDTPASEVVDGKPRFVRGAKVLRVDGQDAVNGADPDALNAALFPATAGEVHSFEVLDPGASAPRTVRIEAADLSRVPVNRTRIIDTADGKVGYILFNTFSPRASEEAIVATMEEMQAENVEDLVLDLRYNGGGLLAVASQLSYMIAGPAFTSARDFERLRFNDDAGGTNPVTGGRNDPIPFYSETLGFSTSPGEALPRLDLGRVFILSTERTCSASEAVINGLRGIGFEVVLIGDTTCGKPFGFYPTDNCGETYYTIQFQGVNDRGFGDYAEGFSPQNGSDGFAEKLPGCAVPDDFANALGSEEEGLLAAALSYRSTGVCPPTVPMASQRQVATKGDRALAVGRSEGLALTNRDMRLPGEMRE